APPAFPTRRASDLPADGSADRCRAEGRRESVVRTCALPCRVIWSGTGSAGQHRVQRLDQRGLVHRLGQVVAGTLALAPDLIGFLILGGDDDDGNVTGFLVLGQLAGGLEAVEA